MPRATHLTSACGDVRCRVFRLWVEVASDVDGWSADGVQLVVTTQEPVEWFRVIELDLLLQALPEGLMLLGWAGEHDVIDVHRQQEAILGEPEGRRVGWHDLAAKTLEDCLEVVLPVGAGLGMAVQRLD